MNELARLVDESGLETTKAKVLLDKFSNYFDIAAEWETKAKSIVVKDESQTADMEMARVGRLFLRDKRIAVEKTRKELKEQSLREGKAIDGIANVLKAVIVPIEEYLEKQEKFIQIKEEAAREAKRKEIERRMEEERLAEEKAKAEAEAAERERMRIENERLKAESVEREKAAAEERKKQEEILAKQREEAEAERKRQAEILAKQKAEFLAKQKAIEEKARKERAAAEAERKRLEEQLKNMVECPFCHKTFKIKGE
jgi:colicin import membrane protein